MSTPQELAEQLRTYVDLVNAQINTMYDSGIRLDLQIEKDTITQRPSDAPPQVQIYSMRLEL